MSSRRPYLRDYPPGGLVKLMQDHGQPAYRGRQLGQWLFQRGALEWDEMTNLPRHLRRQLAASFQLQGLQQLAREESKDGTRKLLFALPDHDTVESVIIPMQRHTTFCLSCQVGCRMACRFCATARGGLKAQLCCAEILEQVIHLHRDLAIHPYPGHGQREFNVVFMGMGEPLDNWEQVSVAILTLIAKDGFGMSARRITISTSGQPAHLRKMLEFPYPIGLTLSLGGATPAVRSRLMPVAGRSPLDESLKLAAAWARRTGRAVTLAYVLIAGLTDSLQEADHLARLARKYPFKVNLIPLNRLEEDPLTRPEPQRILSFQKVLRKAGIKVFIRESGGQDIAAACGQLRHRHRLTDPNTAGLE